MTRAARFEVSSRLRADFDNSKVYYALHGEKLKLPANPVDRPDPLALRWHNDQRFLAA